MTAPVAGSQVSWYSSAAGFRKAKKGTVVQVVPAGERPKLQTLVQRHSARSSYGGGGARKHESYIVLVPGATAKAKPTLYWPVASLLEVVS